MPKYNVPGFAQQQGDQWRRNGKRKGHKGR